jgi:hypothetical protein
MNTILVCPRCSSSNQIRKVSTVAREDTTYLARALAMPPRPGVDRSLGTEIGWGVGIAFLLWIVVVGALGATRHYTLATIVLLLIILGLVVWILFVVNRYNEEKNWIESQTRLYPMMQRIWKDDLYYCPCSHDGVIFRGNRSTQFASPSRMIEFLVDQAEVHQA